MMNEDKLLFSFVVIKLDQFDGRQAFKLLLELKAATPAHVFLGAWHVLSYFRVHTAFKS